MKLAIMQPYFMPYLGYFQLINAVDTFVIYDNIQFTKKGWIHRNRMLMNGKDKMFSLPLKKDSDYLDVNQRYLSEDSGMARRKILRQIRNAYSKAPFFVARISLVEQIFLFEEENLFDFILNSILLINEALGINTEIIKSSQLEIDHNLKSQNKVIAICGHLKADKYYNPIGGVDLYDRDTFHSEGLILNFLKSNLNPYKQYNNSFIPALSILDVLMFCDTLEIQRMLTDYELQ